MYCDAHIHIDELVSSSKTYNLPLDSVIDSDLAFCTSSNTEAGFLETVEFCNLHKLDNAVFSFGVHPQNPVAENLYLVENLCEQKKISAIGEIGFDIFNSDFSKSLEQQKEVWSVQISLACKYNLPVVIHSRKALPILFDRSKELKKVPAVIFHGWSGSPSEANAFLRRGVNAFFSIGKSLLRKQKTVIQMARDFDISRLLTETDAPFMTLQNEPFTKSADIKTVVQNIFTLRREKNISLEELKTDIFHNFQKAFNV